MVEKSFDVTAILFYLACIANKNKREDDFKHHQEIRTTHQHSLRVGWRNNFSDCAIVSVFWLWQEMVFGFPSVLRVQFMMAHRNSNFKGKENGQIITDTDMFNLKH
jgi:hypothetical protein